MLAAADGGRPPFGPAVRLGGAPGAGWRSGGRARPRTCGSGATFGSRSSASAIAHEARAAVRRWPARRIRPRPVSWSWPATGTRSPRGRRVVERLASGRQTLSQAPSWTDAAVVLPSGAERGSTGCWPSTAPPGRPVGRRRRHHRGRPRSRARRPVRDLPPAGLGPRRGEAAVGARGLTGPPTAVTFLGRRLFVLPASPPSPAAARAMLEYRIRRLPAARLPRRRRRRGAGSRGSRPPTAPT